MNSNPPNSKSPRFESVACLSFGSLSGLHRFAWAEWGERENPRVLVCVHGLTRSGRDFDALAKALASDYRVVCPDIAGRGRSDWLEDSKLYAIPQYVSDCVTLVARLGAEQIDWVGTSMGGLVGMGLAALEKTPIRRLVLNDVGPVLQRSAIARIGDYVGRKTNFSNFQEGEEYLRKIHASFGPHSDEEWHALSESSLVAEPGGGVRLHYDPRIGDAFRTPEEVARLSEDTAVPESLWSGYDRIRAETLAIRGEQSDLLSAAAHAEMGTRGPKARLVTLSGIGHAPTLMHGDQIEIVRTFLNA